MKESESLVETRWKLRARASKGMKQMMWEQNRKENVSWMIGGQLVSMQKNSGFLWISRYTVHTYNASSLPVISFSENSYRKVTRKS